jgi:putative transposase
MKKQHIQLSETDREYLEKLVSSGELAVRVYRRAIGLLELDRGKSYQEVANTLDVHHNTVSTWAKKYKIEGISSIQDKPRSGRPIEIDGRQRAKITALACSEPPEGYAKWSLRLLADKAVALEYCEHISHSEVRDILKKTNSSLT